MKAIFRSLPAVMLAVLAGGMVGTLLPAAVILVYLLLADRAIEVVADRALHRRIAPADWQTLVEAMRGPLHEGRHEQALQTAVATLDGWLRQHFPADPSPARTRDNELPDPVELG